MIHGVTTSRFTIAAGEFLMRVRFGKIIYCALGQISHYAVGSTVKGREYRGPRGPRP